MGRRQRQKQRADRGGRSPGTPEPSGRYTPRRSASFRVRPSSHKVIGAVQLVIGIAIVVINYIDYANVRLLPGGHQEGYFILGIAIAGASSWWFGAFDRQPSPDEVRRQYSRERS